MGEFILNDTAADDLILDIHALREEKERYNVIAKQQIQAITDRLQTKNNAIDDSIEFNKYQLKAFFLTVDKKSTKTQETYSLLSGKLVLKKATQKIAHADNVLEEYLNNNGGKEYIKETITTKIDWAGLKKELVISNNKIVNISTGEVMKIESGITLEDVNESFDIK